MLLFFLFFSALTRSNVRIEEVVIVPCIYLSASCFQYWPLRTLTPLILWNLRWSQQPVSRSTIRHFASYSSSLLSQLSNHVEQATSTSLVLLYPVPTSITESPDPNPWPQQWPFPHSFTNSSVFYLSVKKMAIRFLKQIPSPLDSWIDRLSSKLAKISIL